MLLFFPVSTRSGDDGHCVRAAVRAIVDSGLASCRLDFFFPVETDTDDPCSLKERTWAGYGERAQRIDFPIGCGTGRRWGEQQK